MQTNNRHPQPYTNGILSALLMKSGCVCCSHAFRMCC